MIKSQCLQEMAFLGHFGGEILVGFGHPTHLIWVPMERANQVKSFDTLQCQIGPMVIDLLR